ncbi:hypothetical protein GCM10011594_40380 [Nakamurella endophytica]|uniref:TIGR00725 family protein n=1 Tax=Nakamurella endophytica TaxID=1748367 RepID=A0A917TD64_9ACTN|nr:hypothetical protein GCM10011594_40380 [Nakamurella endophytica]
MRRLVIAVVGPSDISEGDSLFEHAVVVGRAVAQHGAILSCGGLGGVMAAAARGARQFSSQADVVGFLPGSDANEADENVSIPIPTEMGEMRNWLVVRSAHGVISIGGSWGTLSEVALAVRHGLPVVSINGWAVSTYDGISPPGVHEESNPANAVSLLCALVARSAAE